MKKHMYFQSYCGPIRKRIDDILSRIDMRHKKIILFGLNSSSFVVHRYLKEKGFDVCAYVDNSEEKLANSNIDTAVMSPDKASALYGDKAIFFITSKYYMQMKAQLETFGYKENQHFFQVIDVKKLEQYVDFSDVKDCTILNKEQLKKVQIHLLSVVKQVCAALNLRYYLTGGTLLGAVRHKGYIPWDDDIDIVMPMKDYKVFGKWINEHTEYEFVTGLERPEEVHSFYGRLLCPGTILKTWDYPYMATLGINIDIFPLYGVPEGTDEAERYADEMERLHVSLLTELIQKPHPTKRYYDLQKQIFELMDMYAFDESTNIAYLLSRHKKKEIMPRKIYDESLSVPFEDEYYNIPKMFEDYLIRLFGRDYMELPPEEERVTNHNYCAGIYDWEQIRKLQIKVLEDEKDCDNGNDIPK